MSGAELNGKPITLADLRDGIDAIDDHIHDLLMQRAELVEKVGEVKGASAAQAVYYRPEREAQIHRRIEARHHGPLPIEAVHRIYREIISASLNMEKQLTVAYLGPEATFTHQAAIKQFGSSFHMYAQPTIDAVFHEVEVGRVNFGVAPVENSNEGAVTHTLDRFVDSPLIVCGEILLPVQHNLLSRRDSLSDVKRIYGHRRALADCHQWLDAHLPHVERVESESTAAAALKARDEEGAAAIAGEYAADSMSLNLLAEHIEDRAGQENRFLVVGRIPPKPSGDDKTSIMVSFQDHPGFLHKVLGLFAERGINLTRIESRPSQTRTWDYLFFIDCEGHQDDPRVAEALQALADLPGVTEKILGSYPKRAL
ncbi:prephenate dehydratase [Magnetofaba australis]|uniref:Bifunctional chorismate mutase/prephenate dehydratase n=1 Tax=Magnetofaba australis IT-1 TaxID=1434232 RepID=A0A1Y2KA06_9PROT|nr:prephenate dehydratase [Magnetofaba australis]OSM06191.1 putative chorismate mutase [Magnetofaba australis IT-1]